MPSPIQEKDSIVQTGAPSELNEHRNTTAEYGIEGPGMHLKSDNAAAAATPLKADTKANVDASSPITGTFMNEKAPSSTTTGTPTATSGLRARNSATSRNEEGSLVNGSGLATTASAVNAQSPFSNSNNGAIVNGGHESDTNTAFERSRPPSDNKNTPNRQGGGDGGTDSILGSKDGSSDDFAGLGGIPWSERTFGYQFLPFRGMYHDIKLRLPYYATDWTLAFKPNNMYRVVAASIRMYFVNLLPAIAYLLDMNHRTDGAYGINEVLLASAIPAIIFPIFSCQPLTIVGVTGLINLFNYTDFNIVTRYGVDFLQFQTWMLIWAAVFHFLVAIFNISDYSRFITDMTSETFGFYVGIVYIQKGIELIIFEFEDAEESGWLVVVIAIMFSLSVYFIQRSGGLGFGPFWFRQFLSDFAMPLSAVWWSGFAHIPGEIKDTPLRFLPITRSFFPSTYRSWVIPFWELEGMWIAAAIPFGFLLMLLFYFDHNVSSLMAQARQYPVKRPAGFHWDFFVLGWVTFVSGILGLPAPNGLVPQAPVNSESLSVLAKVDVNYDAKEGIIVPEEDYESWKKRTENERKFMQHKVVRTRIIEQRVSHLAIGLLTLGTMTRPLLVCLGLMPRALFAGVFLVVGWGSIEGNGITHKTLFLLRDRRMTPRDHILLSVRRRKIFLYVFIQWLFFAMTLAISQTIAAIGFPVIITLLIPLRYYFGPKWFSPEDLAILDAPTANSPAVMVSIGSDLARVTGEGKIVAEDTGIAGTLAKTTTGDEEQGQLKRRLSLYQIRSRQEEDAAHIQNVTSIRR